MRGSLRRPSCRNAVVAFNEGFAAIKAAAFVSVWLILCGEFVCHLSNPMPTISASTVDSTREYAFGSFGIDLFEVI